MNYVNCSACVAFRADADPDSPLGDCRRHAPQPADAGPVVHVAWPTVDRELDGCCEGERA